MDFRREPPPLPGRRNVRVGVSSIIAGVLALLCGGVCFFWRLSETKYNPIAFALLVSVWFLAAFAAIGVGFLGLIIPSRERIGPLVGGMALGAIGLVGMLAILFIDSGQDSLFDLSETSIDTEVEVAPIEIRDDALSVEDYRNGWRQWLIEKAVKPELETIKGKDNEEITEQILYAFVETWCNEPDGPIVGDWNELATRLLDIRHGSPLSLLIVSNFSERPKNVLGMQSPIQNFRKQVSNPFWRLVVELNRTEMMSSLKSENRLQDADRQVLAAFEELLRDGWFQGDEFLLLADLIRINHFPAFLERNGEEVIALLEKYEVPEWVTDYAIGEYQIDLAWNARGSGYSGTVTEEGWKQFHEHLEAAAQHLEKSWEANPNVPMAARAMITVCMGDSDDPAREMRLWFDRSIAAQPDYFPAYDAFLYGMRPRWHGSVEELFAFGERCLETARFDTQVPYYYFAMLRTAAKDVEGDIFTRDDVYLNLQELYLGYIEASTTPERKDYWRTTMGLVAFRNRDFDVLSEQWALLEGSPPARAMRDWRFVREDLEFRIAVGDGGEKINRAEALRDSGRHRNALRVYQSALVDFPEGSPEHQAIQRRIALVEMQDKYDSGEWVDLFWEHPELWKDVIGTHSFKDGEMLITSPSTRFTVEHPIPLGRDFEVEVELATLPEMIPDTGPGILVSTRRFETTSWNAFYLTELQSGKRNFEIARHRYRQVFKTPAPAEERMRLGLICHRKMWEPLADGKAVSQGPVEVSAYYGDGTRIAVGGWTTNPIDKFQQKVYTVRVRKLAEPTKG